MRLSDDGLGDSRSVGYAHLTNHDAPRGLVEAHALQIVVFDGGHGVRGGVGLSDAGRCLKHLAVYHDVSQSYLLRRRIATRVIINVIEISLSG